MSGWRRALWGLGALGFLGNIASGAVDGDWMQATAAMAGLAALLPFWLRAERQAVDA